jgi:hypothetical protein
MAHMRYTELPVKTSPHIKKSLQPAYIVKNGGSIV